MEAIVYDYSYTKSSTSYRTGVKGGRRPRGAVAGGNGSFYVATPPVITLLVKSEDGKKRRLDISDEISTYIHGYLDKRVTEKQVSRICQGMLGASVELSEDNQSIEDIGQYFPD